jgi:hypothetical protein
MVIRVLTWVVALGGSAAIVQAYDRLPETLPVTRWTSGPKSPLLAFRVPLINLLSLGLVEVLGRGLSRVREFKHADAVVAVLLLTAAAKSAIEAAGILLLPRPFSWTMPPLVAVLVVGLGAALWLGRELLQAERWRELKLTRFETVAVSVLLAAIVALDLPLVLAR